MLADAQEKLLEVILMVLLATSGTELVDRAKSYTVPGLREWVGPNEDLEINGHFASIQYLLDDMTDQANDATDEAISEQLKYADQKHPASGTGT